MHAMPIQKKCTPEGYAHKICTPLSRRCMPERDRVHICTPVRDMHVQGRDLSSGTILRGCLHLVDLAVSERVDKYEATRDRLKEA